MRFITLKQHDHLIFEKITEITIMKNFICVAFLAGSLISNCAYSQSTSTINNGHSHNDYHQNIPLLKAYYDGLGSIEADVFLKKGVLYVAHDTTEIRPEATLTKVYLAPLAALYAKNENRPYKDATKNLQLVIDIKEGHIEVLAQLIKDLKPYNNIFNKTHNPRAIKLVISGDMPDPTHFKDFPDYISFDGRPNVNYTKDQLERIAMVSEDLKQFTIWNGKGIPVEADAAKMKSAIDRAHQMGKPFRFWATQDSPNTWIVLQKMGADWINTDHPDQLADFYLNRKKLTYTNPKAYPIYEPAFKVDGLNKKVKNVILLIGDGMGLAQIHAGQIANHGNLTVSRINNIGFSQTGAADSDNTDSAAGGSAMATGEKTNNRFIGVTPDLKKTTNLVDTLAHYGVKSGIISVGDITDATPAAFYAHQSERTMSSEIAEDLLKSKVSILLGSNRNAFLKNKDTQLISKLEKEGFQLNSSVAEFSRKDSGKQLVLVEDSVTRSVLKGRGDFLKTSLLHTIEMLSKNPKGFFIMAEAAQIDYGGHANDLPYVVTEMHDFDKTIAAALKFADEDGETLVVITADHETGGLTLLDASAAHGEITGSFSTNDHTNIMVPVFAYGPQSGRFKGVYQNTEIFHKILKVLKYKK
jgi:alkaline phosphatase